MATNYSMFAWEIPRTEEPGRLQSIRLQKSRTWLNDWTTGSLSFLDFKILFIFTELYLSIRESSGVPVLGVYASTVGRTGLIPG